jgi:hypothetical protein
MADQEALKRDERWYFGMESTTAKTSSWRQCRYCRAYAESPSGQSVPFVHLAPCPVGELDDKRKERPMRYERPSAGQWVQPIRRGYRLACCDCGLVHRMDFRMGITYLSAKRSLTDERR